MSGTEVAPDPWVGLVVDERYRVLARLGDGGMGNVYEAEHLKLGKRVALKVIRPELVSDDEIRARFEREARATASIEHPHVATATDFGALPDGGAYLVTQLVRGISLRDRLAAGATGWREACEIGSQVADALAAIHGLGFVHRDLTPDNVLLSKRDDGTPFVHVLDLGVVGVIEAPKDRRLTAEGHIVGTAGYMAPEQALGQPTDSKADLYALGVLLWEMCTGRALFPQRELTQVVAVQLTEPVPPPEAPSGEIPAQLAALIRALLEPQHQNRANDAGAVRDELRSLKSLRTSVRRGPAPRWLWAAVATAGSAIALVVAFGAVLAMHVDDEPKLAAVATTEAVPSPPSASSLDAVGLSDAQAALYDRFATSARRSWRRDAARELLATDPPAGLRAAADLELATTCAERADALERITAAADPRARPTVERFREAPRTGCGRGRRGDCYACIRAAIEQAWAATEP